MKQIPLSKFKIDGAISRGIARQRGEVQHSYDTNRKGAYYYSCSGHGGFIVDRKALTLVEQDTLDGLGIKPRTLTIYIGEDNDGITQVFHVSYPNRRRGGKLYSSLKNLRSMERSYYEGEEDCGRAILSYFCDIQYGYTDVEGNKKRTDKTISEGTCKRRYRKEWEQYNGIELKQGESNCKDDDMRHLEHKEDYIVCGAGLTEKGIEIPDGKVLCIARKGNKRKSTDEDRYYIIDTETYRTRGNRGYVIGSNPSQETLVVLQAVVN